LPTAYTMQQNKITILSTRPLNELLINEAKEQGIYIEVVPFIETEPILSVEVQQEVELALLESASIVFTSMNAVEAVAAYMIDEQPDWAIYCMGNTTKDLVKKYFGANTIAGTAGNAADLASLIVEEANTGAVIFFCGDQRRNELPDILKANDIEVNEIEVYHTIPTARKVDKRYNGVLFFSPVAVESFFSKNKADTQTILFAIGNTTATTIKKYAGNPVIISDEPGKGNLVEKAINYFVNNER
jgi:uroporphyrinogen-III synthase